MNEPVAILDTTLRDGLQGRHMPPDGRLEVLRALDGAGLDVIELATFTSRAEDVAPVRRAVAAIRNSTVCVLAYPDRGAIDRAGEVFQNCARPRMHVFNSVLARAGEEAPVLEAIADTVRNARRHTDDVQWGALDASRGERDFVCRAVETALGAGAATINIADTMGLMLPDEFADLIRHVRYHAEGIENATIAVHCHNDLGLATANSLAGIAAGARQVECTLNGLGPRGGNTSLQQIATLLHRRDDVSPAHGGIDLEALGRVAALVAERLEPPRRNPG